MGSIASGKKKRTSPLPTAPVNEGEQIRAILTAVTGVANTALAECAALSATAR